MTDLKQKPPQIDPEEKARLLIEAEMMLRRSESKTSRGPYALIGFLAALLFLAMFWFLYALFQEKQSRDFARSQEKTAERPQSAEQPAKPAAPTTPAAAAPEQQPVVKDGTLVISITENRFFPLTMGGGSWDNSVPLSEARPDADLKFPQFKGGSQRYGALRLGVMDDNRFFFAFDRIEEAHPVLYIDLNKNGDLTDDGGPLTNQGTGRFAAAFSIGFEKLKPGLNFETPYDIWFFINDFLWEKGHAAFYSRTRLKGQITVNDREYTAFIADGPDNDGDYTNNGLFLDLDGDGNIDREKEPLFTDALLIGGKSYPFLIKW